MSETIRDDAVLEEVRVRLRATGAFDEVKPARPVPGTIPTGLRVRSLAWIYWTGATEEPDEGIGAGGPTYERTVEFQVAIEARAADDTERLRRLSRLDSVARNALLVRTADQPWRSLEMGKAVEAKNVEPPAVRVLIPCSAHYTIDAASGRDPTDREGT